MLQKMKLLFLGIVFLMFSCQSSDNKNFNTSETGLNYLIHVENPTEDKPLQNDIVHVNMQYAVNDSIIFSSAKLNREMKFPLMKPVFEGDFYEGIAMMHKGDSASFLMPAERVFLDIFKVKELPDFAKSDDLMRFDIKLIDFMSPEEFEAEQQSNRKEKIIEAENKLNDFLKKENIDVSPTETGLYFVELEKGKGNRPQKGQRVRVHYAGRLTDGLPFDDSYKRGEPYEFELGAGMVIKGWDEGIGMMNEGGRALLVIPYYLAYGEREMGKIPAFSPLVFEVELVEVLN